MTLRISREDHSHELCKATGYFDLESRDFLPMLMLSRRSQTAVGKSNLNLLRPAASRPPQTFIQSRAPGLVLTRGSRTVSSTEQAS